jgi:SAM-dependent methyltransferase
VTDASLAETRDSYDAIAAEYSDLVNSELDDRPLDRALFAAFAELIRAGGNGPVADVGCGSGRVTTLLSRLGLDAFGVDLSPGMVSLARRNYPQLRFEEGSMLALDIPTADLGGLLAYYSIIHTVPTSGARPFPWTGTASARTSWRTCCTRQASNCGRPLHASRRAASQ